MTAFTPHPEHVGWFKRLEDKLRNVYNVLTCTRSTDVVPRCADPSRHSSHTRDSQVSASHHSMHRQEPRPCLTPLHTPPPPPTSQPDLSQPGSSSWHLHRPTYHLDPSQPSSSSWQPPPNYPYGMPEPNYQYQMPEPNYQYGMPQPNLQSGWNPSAAPLSQAMGLGMYFSLFVLIYIKRNMYLVLTKHLQVGMSSLHMMSSATIICTTLHLRPSHRRHRHMRRNHCAVEVCVTTIVRGAGHLQAVGSVLRDSRGIVIIETSERYFMDETYFYV